jgi:hypothetical protein
MRSSARQEALIILSPPRCMYYRSSNHQLVRDPLLHDPFNERSYDNAAGFSPYRPAGTHTVG